MNDILNRIKAGHQPPSEQLRDAQALLRSSLSYDEKLTKLEALAKAAPPAEREQFGDLLSNLNLQVP